MNMLTKGIQFRQRFILSIKYYKEYYMYILDVVCVLNVLVR